MKGVFGNCRLIGRRFRIAHVIFKGGKIIEVSTFRKKGEEEEEEQNRHSLLIKRDNTFGSPAEDAFRRDFTINGLYYNIADFTILDYVGGRADLENRLIRCIGDPDIRFQEDPIRILRGIRLAATLDFQVEDTTWDAMKRQCHHIGECAVSRIREEIMKILRRSGADRAFMLLAQAGVFQIIFPGLEDFRASQLEAEQKPEGDVWQYLAVIDNLRSRGAEFEDPLLLAALFAAPLTASLKKLPPDSDVGKWMHGYLEENFKPLAIPRIARSQVLLLHLALRHMLAPKPRRRRQSLRRSPLFADSLTLLEIHCQATQSHWAALHRWQRPTGDRQHRRG
jgi:poly(A) polymerase